MRSAPASMLRRWDLQAIILAAAPNSLPRFTRPNRIGGQRIDVRIGMTDQRNSFMDRLGPNESLALWGAVLVGGDGVGEDWHRVRMREGWLTGA